jgi:hypothetical protein
LCLLAQGWQSPSDVTEANPPPGLSAAISWSTSWFPGSLGSSRIISLCRGHLLSNPKCPLLLWSWFCRNQSGVSLLCQCHTDGNLRAVTAHDIRGDDSGREAAGVHTDSSSGGCTHFFVLFCFFETGSHYVIQTGWLWTCCDPAASASRGLGVPVCTNTPSLDVGLSLFCPNRSRAASCVVMHG